MESYRDGIDAFAPSGIGHECGIHAPLQHGSLRSIFGRLRGARSFTDSISKAFTEYVEWIHPYQCVLTPVSLISTRRGDHAWWRKDAPYITRVYRPRELSPEMLAYPYVRGTPSPQHEMLLKVHGMIPSRITGDLRADLCQDLFVAILSGELTIENVPDAVRHYARQARKTAPDRWKAISMTQLDEMIGVKGGHYIDLHRSQGDFAPDLCDVIHEHESESGVAAAHWNKEGIVTRRDSNDVPRKLHRSHDSAVRNHTKQDAELRPRDRIRRERPHWKSLRGEWGDYK